MRRTLPALALAAALASPSARAAGAEGFVPYDPASGGQVSGALLLVAAYGVVCGLLGLYALTLLLRARALEARARRLRARIDGSPGATRPAA